MHGIQTVIVCHDCNKHWPIRIPAGKVISETLRTICQEHKPVEKELQEAVRKLERALWN